MPIPIFVSKRERSIEMPGLRRTKTPLRKSRFNKAIVMINDVIKMAEEDGDTVTFEWKERVGATWNETYEVWEGGAVTTATYTTKGFGKVVDFAEDEMEYEWGRVAVGDCLIRFPIDFDIEQFSNKEELRFTYKGQRWKPDNKLGVGDWLENHQVSKILKGVKTLD